MGWRAAAPLLAIAIALAVVFGATPALALNTADLPAPPTIACGQAPGGPPDYWGCNPWETENPHSLLQSIPYAFGRLTLSRIDAAFAKAQYAGQDFGAFRFPQPPYCDADAYFYFGYFTGAAAGSEGLVHPGKVIACTAAGGATLSGNWQADNSASGNFTMILQAGGPPLAFAGEFLQFTSGLPSNVWAGTCAACPAYSPPSPPAPTPPAPTPPGPTGAVPAGSPPGQPPILGPPIYRIVHIGLGAERHRSAADHAVREPKEGWLLGAGDTISVFPPVTKGAGLTSDDGVELQDVRSGATFRVRPVFFLDLNGNEQYGPAQFEAGSVPTLRRGQAKVASGGGATSHARETANVPVTLRTPVALLEIAGTGVVTHDPVRQLSAIRALKGQVTVTPANPALGPLVLVPGRQTRVTPAMISPPLPFTARAGGPSAVDLARTIPSPRQIRAGPATATAPSRLSLRSLLASRCVRVGVRSTQPARVLVTIFSGRRSVRLFGQRLVRFAAAGRTSTCIPVPAHARSFGLRTPVSFALGYALGARARAGERKAAPVVRPIALVS